VTQVHNQSAVVDADIQLNSLTRTSLTDCLRVQKSSGYASMAFVGQTLKTAPLGAEWTEVQVQLPAAERQGKPVLYLRFGGAVGSVFWDDASLHANSTVSTAV
jgi:hypothetical protein